MARANRHHIPRREGQARGTVLSIYLLAELEKITGSVRREAVGSGLQDGEGSSKVAILTPSS